MFSDTYKQELFSCRTYEKLVELSALLCGSKYFDAGSPTYGLKQPVFLFIEVLTWFAQSLRSGSITYFEATPESRISAMREALESLAPIGFASHYAQGAASWKSNHHVEALDKWLEQNEEKANAWLSRLVEANRADFEHVFT